MQQHRIPSDTHNAVRVMFPLRRDEEGYPPVDNETMWALAGDLNTYRLDNIPFYACGVSLGDVIAADAIGDGLFRFRTVIEPSLHSTLRVVLVSECEDARPMDERMAELRRRLEQTGCSTEANYPGFFAVDVPPPVALSSVRSILSPGFNARHWDYEEATLWHTER